MVRALRVAGVGLAVALLGVVAAAAPVSAAGSTISVSPVVGGGRRNRDRVGIDPDERHGVVRGG